MQCVCLVRISVCLDALVLDYSVILLCVVVFSMSLQSTHTQSKKKTLLSVVFLEYNQYVRSYPDVKNALKHLI